MTSDERNWYTLSDAIKRRSRDWLRLRSRDPQEYIIQLQRQASSEAYNRYLCDMQKQAMPATNPYIYGGLASHALWNIGL